MSHDLKISTNFACKLPDESFQGWTPDGRHSLGATMKRICPLAKYGFDSWADTRRIVIWHDDLRCAWHRMIKALDEFIDYPFALALIPTSVF